MNIFSGIVTVKTKKNYLPSKHIKESHSCIGDFNLRCSFLLWNLGEPRKLFFRVFSLDFQCGDGRGDEVSHQHEGGSLVYLEVLL